MKKNTFIELDKNQAGAVIARIFSGEVEVFAASHAGVVAAALFALGVEGCMFYHGPDIENASSTDLNGKPCCLVPAADDHLQEKFVDAIIFGQLNFQEAISRQGIADIHFRTVVHHLPPELVVNVPATAAPPEFQKELRELNKYVYFPDC